MCLLLQAGSLKPRCLAPQSQPPLGAPEVFPVPSRKEILGKLAGYSGMYRGTGHPACSVLRYTDF